MGLAKAIQDLMNDSITRVNSDKGLSSRDIENLGKEDPTYLVDTVIELSKDVQGSDNFKRASSIYFFCNKDNETTTLNKLGYVARAGRKDPNVTDKDIYYAFLYPFQND